MKAKPLRVFAAASAAAMLFCGCAHVQTVLETRVEVVYNPGTGIFTFAKGGHPPFVPRDIVRALKNAGIAPDMEIYINMRTVENQRLITEIAALLANGGFQKSPIFCTDEIAESRGSYYRSMDMPRVTTPPRGTPVGQ